MNFDIINPREFVSRGIVSKQIPKLFGIAHDYKNTSGLWFVHTMCKLKALWCNSNDLAYILLLKSVIFVTQKVTTSRPYDLLQVCTFGCPDLSVYPIMSIDVRWQTHRVDAWVHEARLQSDKVWLLLIS